MTTTASITHNISSSKHPNNSSGFNSMTAFAKEDAAIPTGMISWEMRSVNHRYLDFNFRLPDSFASLEPQLRELARHKLQRGRIDFVLRYQSQLTIETANINHVLAEKILQSVSQLAKNNPLNISCNIMDVLRWPGVMQTDMGNTEILHQASIALFNKTLDRLIITRQREGAQVQALLCQRVYNIEEYLLRIKQRIPLLLSELRERLLARLHELKNEVDLQRLEQELIYFAHKLDVEEEIDRFQLHIAESKRVLEAGGAVGRRLDFLLQELQREINTLGVKSNDKLVSQSVVDIKVLLEQVREQAQNVE